MKTLHVLVSASMLTAPLAVAQSPEILLPLIYSSGGVGIARGQAAKWKVTNTAPPPPVESPACAATLSFTNDQGQELKTEEVTVRGGESRSLDLDHSEVPTTGGRAEIHARAVIPITGPVDQPIPGNICPAVLTLEIIDNATGKTTAVVLGTLVQSPLQVTGRAVSPQ
jgi:hypothetical protein